MDDAPSSGAAGTPRLLLALARDDQRRVLPTLANALLILALDPILEGMLGYDEFAGQHLLLRPPPPAHEGDPPAAGPYPRTWQAEDVALVQAHLQRVWAHRFGRETTEQAMLAEAARRRYHPVRDWLASLRWDGTPRLDDWLRRAFGAPDDDYHRAAGAKFLVAAVRRVRHPGCKFDALLVLEGAQGIGKSSACRALFGAHWFSDAVPADLGSKDAAMALCGVWGLEFAEIEHLIRAEVETIKSFLSRQVDRYRPPYGKSYVERPRQCVFVGTTNATDYLRDSSGNRRIWPVACRHADAAWVADHREQLWAEAAAREAAGETIWLDDDDTRMAASRQQQARMAEDIWAERIRAKLAEGVPPNSRALLDAIGVPAERQGKREEMRIASILRAEGYVRAYRWRDGRAIRIWIREPEPP
ncbi:virulence-associated E family protein [Caldovatus sediminis]|uniref:virulence-associated E family protein n=1 Tax=Caldovatus sediminis TaxID=2041189 RepID=UPI00166E0D17|nr:virulence-associated E family protein [Caldovatus sediminis]